MGGSACSPERKNTHQYPRLAAVPGLTEVVRAKLLASRRSLLHVRFLSHIGPAQKERLKETALKKKERVDDQFYRLSMKGKTHAEFRVAFEDAIEDFEDAEMDVNFVW